MSACGRSKTVPTLRLLGPPALGQLGIDHAFGSARETRKAETLKLHRRQAFAGFLIVGLIALVGFAAFSATDFRSAPPVDLPDDISARIAGQLLGVDLGPDSAEPDATPEPSSTTPDSANTDAAPSPGSTPLVTAWGLPASLAAG